MYIGRFSTKVVSVYSHKVLQGSNYCFIFWWVRILKSKLIKSLFNSYNKSMENPYFEFMASFPVHCSFHQSCISCVDCNGAMIESPHKGYLKIVLLFQPKYFIIVKCGDLYSCAYSALVHQRFAWHSFKVLTYKWKHMPSLISCVCSPLIQYPPSHPDAATSNELTIIFKLLSMSWYLHTSWGKTM